MKRYLIGFLCSLVLSYALARLVLVLTANLILAVIVLIVTALLSGMSTGSLR